MADPRAASLEPIFLISWPTCTDNLSWSDDHLAVAVGESVHVLTPRARIKALTAEHAFWHVETIRVNQFTDKEWPMLAPTTLTHLSLGEEQSSSTVCSLAWSTEGVGVHTRTVLAVLTTNLILSLWESNGEIGTWRRAFIVNPTLRAEGDNRNRKEERARAFAWLPTIRTSPNERQGPQLLIVADDDDNAIILHVKRETANNSSDWKAALIYKHKLPPQENVAPQRQSLLQQALQASPISKIECGNWQKLMDESGAVTLMRLRIAFYRGPSNPGCADLLLNYEQTHSGWEFQGHDVPHVEIPNGVTSAPSLADFEIALVKPKADFNEHFDLRGHVRVRHWGSATSPDGAKIAACVTMHPSDMIEYSLPSTERCTVIFAPVGSATPSGVEQLVREDPLLQLLNWIAASSSIETIKNDLDVKLLRVAAGCIYTAFNSNTDLMEWSRAAEELASNFEAASDADGEGDTYMDRQSGFVPATTTESCEMCEGAIGISQDLASGRCSTGHAFARCGISFLAIQEPGISKYCSRCGRQFLNIAKLEPQEGPSLALALFEEFDVCPYCRGKFRG